MGGKPKIHHLSQWLLRGGAGHVPQGKGNSSPPHWDQHCWHWGGRAWLEPGQALNPQLKQSSWKSAQFPFCKTLQILSWTKLPSKLILFSTMQKKNKQKKQTRQESSFWSVILPLIYPGQLASVPRNLLEKKNKKTTESQHSPASESAFLMDTRSPCLHGRQCWEHHTGIQSCCGQLPITMQNMSLINADFPELTGHKLSFSKGKTDRKAGSSFSSLLKGRLLCLLCTAAKPVSISSQSEKNHQNNRRKENPRLLRLLTNREKEDS